MLKKLAEYLDVSVKTVIIGSVVAGMLLLVMLFFGIDPTATVGVND